MTECRRKKVHYLERVDDTHALCGIAAERPYRTTIGSTITCRVCQFHYLADKAPWARAFLNDLRGAGHLNGLRGATSRADERAPGRPAEPVNGIVEGASGGLGGAFGQERRAQEVVSEVLTVTATFGGI